MSVIKKTSEIRFKIGLDEKNIPVDIKWQATDSKYQDLVDCKSIMLSIWDPVENNTLGIELWTNQMTTDEMHAHFFQSLVNIAHSYQKATGSPYVQKDMDEFCRTLAQKTAAWEESKNKNS